jgi:hypothetical protein
MPHLTFIQAALVHCYLTGLAPEQDWWCEEVLTDEIVDWVNRAPGSATTAEKAVSFGYYPPKRRPDLAWCKRIARRLIENPPTLPAWAEALRPTDMN